MIQIRCTYPSKDLSPNARLHWRVFAQAKASFKTMWHYEVLRYKKSLAGVREFHIKFSPPDNRRRDIDNAIGSCKALLDALSGVTGVDDSKFMVTYPRSFAAPVKGGAVFIEFEPIPQKATE